VTQCSLDFKISINILFYYLLFDDLLFTIYLQFI